jgi:type I restriction enzyme R subunit
MVALETVLERLNELFGNEDFTSEQKLSFVEALIRTLAADAALVQQAKVNTPEQFAESPDFDDAVTGAAADNQGAHNRMADYFFTNSPGRSKLVSDLATLFHRFVADDAAPPSADDSMDAD